MVNQTRRLHRKICLRKTKRLSIEPPPLVGIVSMMKDGSVSQPVRSAFRKLGYKYNIYKYNTHDLYNKICNGAETHWFFTGNLPDFVTDIGAPYIDQRIYTITNKMILFICYSHQLAALNAGAIIYTMNTPIIRNIHITYVKDDPIFKELPKSQDFFAYYTQYISADQPINGWKLLATHGSHVAAMKHGKNMYSMQVHPERLDDTLIILENWLSMPA